MLKLFNILPNKIVSNSFFFRMQIYYHKSIKIYSILFSDRVTASPVCGEIKKVSLDEEQGEAVVVFKEKDSVHACARGAENQAHPRKSQVAGTSSNMNSNRN